MHPSEIVETTLIDSRLCLANSDLSEQNVHVTFRPETAGRGCFGYLTHRFRYLCLHLLPVYVTGFFNISC